MWLVFLLGSLDDFSFQYFNSKDASPTPAVFVPRVFVFGDCALIYPPGFFQTSSVCHAQGFFSQFTSMTYQQAPAPPGRDSLEVLSSRLSSFFFRLLPNGTTTLPPKTCPNRTDVKLNPFYQDLLTISIPGNL